MASAPAIPAGYEEIPLSGSDAPAPAPNTVTTPSGMDGEVYRSTLDHLVNTGATRDQINAFIKSAGFSESQIRNLDGALAYRDDPNIKGPKARIQVNPIGGAAPPSVQHDTASDTIPEGYEEIPLNQAAAPQPDAPQTAGGEIALGARHVIDGLTSIPDTLAAFGSMMRGGTPNPLLTNSANGLLNAAGVPNDATDQDRLVGKMIEGATGGAATGGEMAAAPLLAGALGGAGAGGGSELARQNGVGPVGQLAAGLAGGLAGGGAVAGAGGLANAFSRDRAPNPFLQAAKTAGVDDVILPADAGGPAVRKLSSGALQFPFSRGPIIKQAQQLNDKAAEVVAKSAANFSDSPLSGESLGDVMRGGLEKAIQISRAAPKAAYKRAEAIAGDSAVDLQLARATVDDQIARLEATAQTGSIPSQLADLRNLRSQLERPLTVQGVRDMRTELRVAPEHRGTPMDARMQAITEAAGKDAIDSLNAQGKGDAAKAFAQGDKLWAERLNMIDQVISPLIGRKNNPRSSEAIVKSVNATMQGNAARFGIFVHSLPAEEQGVVRASLISGLGKDKDGLFSVSRFADNWRDIQPSAKSALFGKESMEALDALATVGRESKFAMRSNNHSNTAGGLEFGRILTTLTALPSLGVSLGAQFPAGKLLSSPAFARWLASSAKKPNPAAQLAHINRLTKIATANPVIANDILSLQERLAQSFTAQPVAAQDQQPTTRAAIPDPYGQFPIVTNPDKSTWDKRTDGSEKGMGWLGLRQRPDGTVSSEISVGLEVNGKEMDVPVMVPGLTKDEVHWLLTTPVEQIAHKLPRSIAEKASDFAKARIAEGKSPFRGPNEASPIAAVNAAEGGQQ